MNPVRRSLAALAVCAAMVVSGCGVSSENEPQFIEESTEQQPAVTPSFDTETSSPPESSTAPTTPTPGPASMRPTTGP